MKRRNFLYSSLAAGLTLGAAVGGWVAIGPSKESLTLKNTMGLLEQLKQQDLFSEGYWTPQQIFSHCAESIEYSMTGYPEHRSATFKATVGKTAFRLFEAKGAMTHNLEESIPGSQGFKTPISPVDAINRLQGSLRQFGQYNGELAEHFAYGRLSHQEYLLAHIMHINNHFEQIRIA